MFYFLELPPSSVPLHQARGQALAFLPPGTGWQRDEIVLSMTEHVWMACKTDLRFHQVKLFLCSYVMYS